VVGDLLSTVKLAHDLAEVLMVLSYMLTTFTPSKSCNFFAESGKTKNGRSFEIYNQ